MEVINVQCFCNVISFSQITCVVGLYIWCAAADPADLGVFKSKKYLKVPESKRHTGQKDSKLGGQSTSSMHDANASMVETKSVDKEALSIEASLKDATMSMEKNVSSSQSSCLMLVCSPCAFICGRCSSSEESSDQQRSEDGMFYCSLCEVEVCKVNLTCKALFCQDKKLLGFILYDTMWFVQLYVPLVLSL